MDALPRIAAPPFVAGRPAVGLLLLRVVIGVAFIFHGYPKMQHPSAWMTLAMGSHAFAPPWLQAVVAVVEFFGGFALIAGIATPLVSALIFCDMVVALLKVDIPSGARFVGGRHSYEVTVVYLVAMLAFFLSGPGTISLDRWIAAARRR